MKICAQLRCESAEQCENPQSRTNCGAKHSPLTSWSGMPSESFWIEVSNLGIPEIQVRNLKTLHIEIDVGKIYISL